MAWAILPRSKRSIAVFAICWATVGLALGVLLVRLNGLPESIPVFVSVLGTPTRWAPTSIVMVTRIALMGAGQLGAVTALAHATDGGGYSGWDRFFRLMAVAVAAKTLAESVMLAGTGTAWGETTAPVLQALTIVIVLAFLLSAAWMWRKGFLGRVPKVSGLGTQLTIVFSVGVWLTFATIPYWW
jgi:hypothetical protein